MIVPISTHKNGRMQDIGTAAVERVGPKARDFEVTFYLKAGFSLQDAVRTRLERDLITMARSQEKQNDWDPAEQLQKREQARQKIEKIEGRLRDR